MLDFDHKAIRDLDVGNVELASLVSGGNLLPFSRKIVLPRSVPVSFRLPPIITMTLPLMGPVPDFLRTALRDQRCSAPRTEPNRAGSGLHSYIFRKRKFHPEDISMVCEYNKVEWADTPQNRGGL